MELTKMELFKAMNDKHTNLKDCEGLIISPVAHHTHTYSDADGNEHSVLVIKNGKDGQMYKTEVSAFIEKFIKYLYQVSRSVRRRTGRKQAGHRNCHQYQQEG